MKAFKEQVCDLISTSIGMDGAEVFPMLTFPPQANMGDVAFPCFKLAKTMSKSPKDVAQDICTKVAAGLAKTTDRNNLVAEAKVFGPYVNFFLNRDRFYNAVMTERLSAPEVKHARAKKTDISKTPGGMDEHATAHGGTKKECPARLSCTSCPAAKMAGDSSATKHGRVVIDYSSPNIAKPIAFHHIRSTVIGNIIGNIFEHNGYDVVRVNYLGDWGTQFGKLITAFEKYGDDKKLEKDGIRHLLDIYVQYHKDEALDKDGELERTARRWFQLMEAGDKKSLEYWKRFRDISIREFERVYKRLDVHFTNIEGESLYNGRTEPVIDQISKKVGTRESEGAVIVDMSAYDMPPVLLKKTDGTTLYATRDITAAMDRWERYAFAESLYVVANQQELHFKQVFKTLELMGQSWAGRCRHVQFGLLHLEDSKMSTREGKVIFLEDVLDQAVELARKAIDEKNPGLEDKDEVAEAIGVGAIIFGDVCKRRIQDITFKWEDVLNFDGETAPYVQYTHARACSILAKAGFKHKGVKIKTDYKPSELEFELSKLLSLFEDRMLEAQTDCEPFFLARYVLDLAQMFNKFYYQEKIIDISEEDQRTAKLALVYSVKERIKECLFIMGIKAPERM